MVGLGPYRHSCKIQDPRGCSTVEKETRRQNNTDVFSSEVKMLRDGRVGGRAIDMVITSKASVISEILYTFFIWKSKSVLYSVSRLSSDNTSFFLLSDLDSLKRITTTPRVLLNHC